MNWSKSSMTGSYWQQRICMSVLEKENGEEILKKDFEKIEWRRYEDSLIVPEPEPLISYILSCHGNQGQYILDHYKEFQSYVRKKTEGGFHITKDAGILSGYNG